VSSIELLDDFDECEGVELTLDSEDDEERDDCDEEFEEWLEELDDDDLLLWDEDVDDFDDPEETDIVWEDWLLEDVDKLGRDEAEDCEAELQDEVDLLENDVRVEPDDWLL